MRIYFSKIASVEQYEESEGVVRKAIIEQTDKLPEGKTCKDCGRWKRCSKLIDELTGEETHCDWDPSRYKESDKA